VKKFEDLTKEQQDRYLRQADYLIEYGYVKDIDDPEKLASQIYERKKVDHH
jgi:hypothetical protein